jgi:hypothetical protein
MSDSTNSELDRQIEEAIKDGVSNTTGEWFNGWICPGLNLNEQQSQDLLFHLTKTNRLKRNIKDLITQSNLALLERVNKEVVGEDDRDYSKDNADEQSLKILVATSTACNDLRADQRKALNNLKQELQEKL